MDVLKKIAHSGLSTLFFDLSKWCAVQIFDVFQTSLTNLELSIVLTLSTVINEGSELVWNCLTPLIHCQLYLLSMKDKGADGSGQIRFIFENVQSCLGVYESEKDEPYRHWLTDPTCFDQPKLTEHN